MYLSADAIKVFYERLYTYAENLGEPLPEPRWEEQKKRIIDSDNALEYYALIDLKTVKIKWHHGIYECLGHQKEEEFDLLFLPSLIHPYIFKFYNAFALGVFHACIENTHVFDYRNPQYTVTMPVKKRDGNYVEIQQISYPVAFDKDGQVVSYLSHYRVGTGPYLGQPLSPNIFINNEKSTELLTTLYGNVAQFLDYIDEYDMFTRRELLILKAAYEIKDEKTNRNKLLKSILHSEVRQNNESIKRKTESMFFSHLAHLPKPNPLSNFHSCLPKLNDVFQISEFLHHSHIMPILNIKLRND